MTCCGAEEFDPFRPMRPEDVRAVEHITNYWYEPASWDRDTTTNPAAQKKWFGGSKEVDDYLRKHFSQVIEDLTNNKLEHWKRDHLGRLAYVIAADQFTRNVYRGNAKAFALDPKALELSKRLIYDEPTKFYAYKNSEKIAFLMPLMHSERSADIQACADWAQKLAE